MTEGKLTLARGADQYLREHIVRSGKPWRRIWGDFKRFFAFVDKETAIEELSADQVEEFIDGRLAQNVNILSVKRELTFVRAMCGHAKKRNRVKFVPYIPVVDGPMRVRRPLTAEEYALVMAKIAEHLPTMPNLERVRRHYIVLDFTGHRSRACEEVKWEQVNFETMTIDFNVPGRMTPKTKRRNEAFPIVPEFAAILQEWKASAKDDYVIGLGPSGKCTSTHHLASWVVRELCGLTDPSLVPRHSLRKKFVTEIGERMVASTGAVDMETIGALIKDNPAMLRKHYHFHADTRLRDAASLRGTMSGPSRRQPDTVTSGEGNGGRVGLAHHAAP